MSSSNADKANTDNTEKSAASTFVEAEKSDSKNSFAPPNLSHRLYRPTMYGAIILAAFLAIIGFIIINQYNNNARERELANWQDKLTLVASSRVKEISQWLEEHQKALNDLANNPSLQIYLTTLQQETDAPAESMNKVEPAQQTYLRNLLLFTADRMKFAPENIPAIVQIPTQIPYQAKTGIAIINNQNRLLVSTPYLQAVPDNAKRFNKGEKLQTPHILNLSFEEHLLGFIMPIYGIQADQSTSPPIARILGIKSYQQEMQQLLAVPGVKMASMRAYLVQKEGSLIYHSFLEDVAPTPFPYNPERLGMASALEHPQQLNVKQDPEGRSILVMGLPVKGTNWSVVVQVDAEEALASHMAFRRGILILFVGFIILIVGGIIAMAAINSSRRSKQASVFFKDLAEHSDAQSKLLQLVTDHQPDAVYILDDAMRYRFANQTSCTESKLPIYDLLKKDIRHVHGPARVEHIIAMTDEAFTTRTKTEATIRYQESDKEYIKRVTCIPLDHIPITALPTPARGVLVVEKDISEAILEKEKRLQILTQLVKALTTIADRRDPHAANHSTRVAEIAFDVAKEMNLQEEMCETARISGLLMNIGKMVVAQSTLTKENALTKDELRAIRESMASSAAFLKDIPFEGPVVQTLQQATECWDGSGPKGMKETDILVTARIISAVNAYVSMTSSRAWRDAMKKEEAVEHLLGSMGTHYDRQVVLALANLVENKGK